MHGTINISDAAVIALHAAGYLGAGGTAPKPAMEIASALGVSYNHLSKVLQRLTRAGLVKPARGPKGGFALSQAGRAGRLRDFVYAIDGPLEPRDCLLKRRVCGKGGCLFGGFLAETNRRFEAVLEMKAAGAALKVNKRG